MEEWEQKSVKNRENKSDYCSNLNREFTQALNTVAMKNIGQNSRKKRRKKINWSPELYELTRAEKEAYDRWKRTNEEERPEAFQEYKVLSRIKRSKVRQSDQKFESKVIREIEELKCKNPKEYWKRLKRLEEKKQDDHLPRK
jgi:hypothetical protein